MKLIGTAIGALAGYVVTRMHLQYRDAVRDVSRGGVTGADGCCEVVE